MQQWTSDRSLNAIKLVEMHRNIFGGEAVGDGRNPDGGDRGAGTKFLITKFLTHKVHNNKLPNHQFPK